MAKYHRGSKTADVDTEGARVRWSRDRLVLGNRYLPVWMEVTIYGFDEPDLHALVELRDGAPRLVQIGWIASEKQSEIAPKHLKRVLGGDGLYLAGFVSELYAMTVVELRDGQGFGNAEPGTEHDRTIRDFLDGLRTGPGKRRITADFLRQVADVYRANFDHAPTEAVSRTFGIKHRMATEYVRQARIRGILPPTKQGRAKA